MVLRAVASTSGGGGGGVTSFNTRTGAVTLQASDVSGVNGVLNNATTTLVAGYNVTSYGGGTISSGTYLPAVGNNENNQQYITNGGAFTLGVPASDGTWIILITNNSSAGTITTSSYTKVTGSSFDTTNTHKFMCFISVVNSVSLLNVIAMQ